MTRPYRNSPITDFVVTQRGYGVPAPPRGFGPEDDILRPDVSARPPRVGERHDAARHAAPADCRVQVETTAHEVRIEVTDDGRGTRGHPSADGGHGLIGMRERVVMYGAFFSAGKRSEGGFAVRARIPREPSSRAGGAAERRHE